LNGSHNVNKYYMEGFSVAKGQSEKIHPSQVNPHSF
jgi:hypothetical protein